MDDMKQRLEEGAAHEKMREAYRKHEKHEIQQQAITNAFSNATGLERKMSKSIALGKSFAVPIHHLPFVPIVGAPSRGEIKRNPMFQEFKTAAINSGYRPFILESSLNTWNSQYEIDIKMLPTVSGLASKAVNAVKNWMPGS